MSPPLGEYGKNGFTLVELMVVIALMGILVAIVVPMFKQPLQRYNLKVAANQVEDNLYYARQMAVTMGKDVSVCFGVGDKGTRCYVKWRLDGVMNNYKAENIIWLDERIKEYDIDEYTQKYGVVYNATGRPERGASIYLTGESGEIICIKIAAVTGRVKQVEME